MIWVDAAAVRATAVGLDEAGTDFDSAASKAPAEADAGIANVGLHLPLGAEWGRTMQQDTLIDGTPASIREVETFLANAFSQAATSLADAASDSARTTQDAWEGMGAGESGAQAVVSNLDGAAIGMGAAIATGALIGSFIAPPAGTTVGAGVGAIVGAAAGIFASGAIDHMWENASEGFVHTVDAGGKEATDAGEAIGDFASDAWGAVVG